MADILLIDDDKELSELLQEYLNAEGFSVSTAYDGAEALEMARHNSYSALILDVMLPQHNGFDVLKMLRQHPEYGQQHTPVIMLTAKGDTIDRVIGLEIGADDYLPKPCDPRELVARLRAILRRTATAQSAPPESGTVQVDSLSLQMGSRAAFWLDQSLPLTGTEFSVLELLVRHAGQVISKDELTEQALGRKLTPYDRSIDVHVSNIRKKLATVGASKDQIINVRGAGYMLTRPSEAPATP
ncbi:response regulator transcription factor [Gilvimarinus agarilyticus]|uniref:response regulator transcription factor n=1 Tax=unclassified Gilvimarinus TaxID=2642066 RepID=UPI001C08D06F|nr:MULTISPECIES: response regulator transcription factor [unclassified Gilvimarinus]MBU2885111.1 response regulator transcription factor [Gilvimarinus agarilyticus]MDO6570009.1 response regulator transcription factor [Gilvimarinus sp. 2_MG-2023]MDO6747275.1 response regulator transcription factor [Gilvimarinus sp. 1_MG-2023]